MNSILEQLYNGEINPAEALRLEGSEYEGIQQDYLQQFESLYAALDEEHQDQLEALMDVQARLEELYCCAYFKEGCKLGIQLICEGLGMDDQQCKPTE